MNYGGAGAKPPKEGDHSFWEETPMKIGEEYLDYWDRALEVQRVKYVAFPIHCLLGEGDPFSSVPAELLESLGEI